MKLLINSVLMLFSIVISIKGTCQEMSYKINTGQIELLNENLFEYTPNEKINYTVKGRYDLINDTILLVSDYNKKMFSIDLDTSKNSNQDTSVFVISPYGAYRYLQIVSPSLDTLISFENNICKIPKRDEISSIQIIQNSGLGYYAESNIVSIENIDSVFIQIDYLLLPQLYYFFDSVKYVIDTAQNKNMLTPFDK